MRAEEWRPAPGFPAYEVSDRGQVRRAAGGMGATAGVVLRPSVSSGEHQVVLYLDGSRHPVNVKTLVAGAFEVPGDGPLLRRLDRSLGPAVTNLRWGTKSEAAQNRTEDEAVVRHRLRMEGEATRLRESGVSVAQIAVTLSCSKPSVYRYLKDAAARRAEQDHSTHPDAFGITAYRASAGAVQDGQAPTP